MQDKPLIILRGRITTPPFSRAARLEAGTLLRLLQRGDLLGMPHSRPMPVVGRRCHELRITDDDKDWRLIYRLDPDAVIVVEIFEKVTRKTPKAVVDACKARLAAYDERAGADR